MKLTHFKIEIQNNHLVDEGKTNCEMCIYEKPYPHVFGTKLPRTLESPAVSTRPENIGMAWCTVVLIPCHEAIYCHSFDSESHSCSLNSHLTVFQNCLVLTSLLSLFSPQGMHSMLAKSLARDLEDFKLRYESMVQDDKVIVVDLSIL